ncbi:kunitz-type U19-barytoxin-Tl1a-like [Diorhabda carinulata]|uniref:kunitz-type U19-barytoxin-Tl1a-like n=1 Tax=Diorhabda carinulata TaxID=1163345 RepID=UPI0025A051F1|nr:kunitz-type U19-barytoxin-Tl1a-like [Diorhabda carinulata]
MNQIIVISSCLLIVSMVTGAPSGVDDHSAAVEPFQVQDCSLQVEDGSVSTCFAAFPRYKWSVSDNDCVNAIYGGCHATKNNFQTKEECLKVAKPVCATK